MSEVEVEDLGLQEEVTTLRADIGRLTALVEALVAAQNQPSLSTQAQNTVILEDAPDEDLPSFVTPGAAAQNWTIVDVPSAIHLYK